MNQKNVLILSAVTVVALGVAAMALKRDSAPSTTSERALLFPELSAHINEIAEMKVEKAGKTATLRREGNQWKLADRGGYPAKFESVKELAVRVAGLEISEAKTARKENHAKLALEWPSKAAPEGEENPAGEAGLVTIKDSTGKELAAVVVGKSEYGGGTNKSKVFVRRAGEDQVYLCSARGSGELAVAPDAKQWIEPKFVELANDRVQSVTIEHPDGEVVEIGRSAANHTQFRVQNLPEGQTERYDGIANGVAQALGYGLALDDVRAITEIDFTKEPLAKARFKSVDGLELVVETAKFEDKTWVKVSAAYVPPPEPAKPAPAEGEPAPADAAAAEGAEKPAEGAETAAAETPAPEMPTPSTPDMEKKDVAKEAAELNQRLSPWAFEVPSYKSDVLARRMKDLIPEPKDESATEDDGLQGALDGLGIDPSTDEGNDGLTVEPAPAPDDEEDAVPAPDDGKSTPK